MKKLTIGAVLFGAALSCGAQTNEELQRKIAEQAATIERQQQRIELLERELTPARVGTDTTANKAPQDASPDSNRALERALVRERAVLLSSGSAEIEPNFVASHSSGDGGYRRTESRRRSARGPRPLLAGTGGDPAGRRRGLGRLQPRPARPGAGDAA